MGEYHVEVRLGYSAVFAPEEMYAGNLIGSCEALNVGVTTIVDWRNATLTYARRDALDWRSAGKGAASLC